ncbi:MAG: CapA family protein, partial [Candidatus Aegiribacteria sp.]|nr:CapA family protein [Candidatus Aegiribacteria sp.]
NNEGIPISDKISHIFDKGIISAFQDSDLVITNLECPLTESTQGIPKTGPSLKADPSCSDSIASLGIGIVDLANNHILDFGASGILDTLKYCKNSGLGIVGAGKDINSARKPLFIDVGKSRLGILAGTESEFSIAAIESPGACPIDPLFDRKRLHEAKEQADIIIYIFHGGNELYEYPSPWMRDYCRYLAEEGADAVICHHSHVISGIEVYHDSPIIYGTGNFLFPWLSKRRDAWYTGYLVKLNLCEKAISGIEIIPYRQCADGEFKVKLSTDKTKTLLLNKIAEISKDIVSDITIQKKWNEYCTMKHKSYISTVLQLSNLQKRMYEKTGKLLFAGKKQANLLRLINTIRCESHRHALLEILQMEVDKIDTE